MIEKLKVVDLLSGIGGRAKGFRQAGYDIICSVDNLSICKDIYGQVIGSSKFILSDIEQITPVDLPETDIITAKLIVGTFANEINKRKYKNGNNTILKIIIEKMPKAFVLELPNRMITSNKSAELKNILESEVFRRYVIAYKVIQEKEFSGFPVSGNQAYMVGIRIDLYKGEFNFPQQEQFEQTIFQEEENAVDDWYRKISFKVDTELQKGKYYMRERGNFYQTDLIHMGYYREMYLVDSWGLRKLTHNECASLKGFEEYDFNKCSNKRDMYMKIAYASNVFIVYAIASELKIYLEEISF